MKGRLVSVALAIEVSCDEGSASLEVVTAEAALLSCMETVGSGVPEFSA